MPKMYQKRKFPGRKLAKCRYEYSTWMGEDLGWVDTFRDIEGEKALTNYYKPRERSSRKNPTGIRWSNGKESSGQPTL